MPKGYADNMVGPAKAGAQAALHAAVEQASKAGWRSSEFWITVGGAGLAAFLALAVANPIGMIAAGVVTAGVAAYGASRGSVKKALGTAALAGLSQVAKEIPGEVGQIAGVVGAVVSAAGK
jgi:hypothetical protein